MESKNIWVAASDGVMDRVKQLIEKDNISVDAKDQNGYTPLHAAVSYDHLDIVQYLLEKKADVAIVDTDGDTPLHVCETVECAEILVNHGADPAQTNQEGFTPYETALDNEFFEVANFLRQRLGLPEVQPAAEEEEGLMASESDEEDRVRVPLTQDQAQRLAEMTDTPSDSQLREIATQMILDSLNNGYANGDKP
ncbi:hypothetical protein IWQ60_001660 [Tieghemiomyces parasiticus]|uniref:Ankyrin n=1 Tax=Tieghemiomyces parasiticus TaxID=78921 RepID=A0A9W8ADQ8_9FUNG|nr:hypothetical protein IWQ60_001660 [Tieghemiomyces parasiticus]